MLSSRMTFTTQDCARLDMQGCTVQYCTRMYMLWKVQYGIYARYDGPDCRLKFSARHVMIAESFVRFRAGDLGSRTFTDWLGKVPIGITKKSLKPPLPKQVGLAHSPPSIPPGISLHRH